MSPPCSTSVPAVGLGRYLETTSCWWCPPTAVMVPLDAWVQEIVVPSLARTEPSGSVWICPAGGVSIPPRTPWLPQASRRAEGPLHPGSRSDCAVIDSAPLHTLDQTATRLPESGALQRARMIAKRTRRGGKAIVASTPQPWMRTRAPGSLPRKPATTVGCATPWAKRYTQVVHPDPDLALQRRLRRVGRGVIIRVSGVRVPPPASRGKSLFAAAFRLIRGAEPGAARRNPAFVLQALYRSSAPGGGLSELRRSGRQTARWRPATLASGRGCRINPRRAPWIRSKGGL